MNDVYAQLWGWSPELLDRINSLYVSLLERGYNPRDVFNRMSDYLDQHKNPDMDACIQYALKGDDDYESE